MNLKLSLKIPSDLGRQVNAAVKPAIDKALKQSMTAVGALVVDRVSQAADKKLDRVSAEEFKNGLRQANSVRATDNGVVVELVGELPNALNDGFNAFDIKAAMLPHAKKFAKDGTPYIDVPFLHTTPSARTGQPMTREAKASIDQAVAAKKLQLTSAGASPHAVATAKARTSVVTPGASFMKNLNFNGKAVPVNVEHKHGLHDEMIRTATKVGRSTANKYTTIRRISANSAATSWWHPGFKGLHLMENIEKKLEDQIKEIFRDTFESNGITLKFK